MRHDDEEVGACAQRVEQLFHPEAAHGVRERREVSLQPQPTQRGEGEAQHVLEQQRV